MSLFGGPKQQSYLGVDIGAGGIKVVELANESGRARLVTYGFSERLPQEMGQSPLARPDETADLLKRIVAKAGCGTKRAVTGIPVSNVFSSVLSVNVPAGKKKELDAAVQQAARKITPKPIEEMVLDYKTVEEGPKATKVLVTAAEASLVRTYVEVFKKAGIELISLETEPLALIRSLVGRDRSTVIVVDVGAVRTSLSVIERGVPFVARSIDVGGLSFTKAIADQLKLAIDAAEQMKMDIATMGTMLPEAGMPKVLEPLSSTIVNELRYVTNLYQSQAAGGSVEKIVLAGGGAVLPRLAEAIGSAVGIRTYVGDPWARVVYPEDLRPILEQIGPRFAVAVGLAMRDIE